MPDEDAFLVRNGLRGRCRRTATDASAEGISCDDSGCVTQAPGAGFVALAQRAEALVDDYDRALIVTAKPPPAGCAASIIGIERLRHDCDGAAAKALTTALSSMRSSLQGSTVHGRRQSQAITG